MKRITATLLLLSALGACGGGSSGDRPGDAGVYARIDGMTDCAALQSEFDTAAANNDRAEPGSAQHKVTLSYMRAAEDRRQELDC